MTSLLDWEHTLVSGTASLAVSEPFTEVQIDQLVKSEQLEGLLRTEYINNETYKTPGNSAKYITVSKENILPYLKEAQHIPSSKTKKMTNIDLFDGFNWNNVLLAGGAVSRALLASPMNEYFDFDFYIYGLHPEKAKLRLQEMIKFFGEKTSKLIEAPMKILRSETAITFIFGRFLHNFQICLTLARDPLELLLSFDIAPSKVAFDGVKILMSPSASLAYGYKAFLITDTTIQASGPTLAQRVNKYRNRGFEVIVRESAYQWVLDSPTQKVVDSYYNVLEDDIITIEEKDDEAGEKSFIEAYRKNPCFIVMRYRPMRFMNDKTLVPGFYWNVHELSWVWFYLNNTEIYWKNRAESIVMYQMMRCKENHMCCPEEHQEENWYADLPYPTLSNEIQFYSLRSLFELLKSRRDIH